jgi:integrase
MKGHVRRRGANSFELKYEAGVDPRTGQRITKYRSFKGTKREAQDELVRLMESVRRGDHVDPSKLTVAEFVSGRVTQWEASNKISAVTAERYRQLLDNQIVPHIGAKLLQKLLPADIERWHTDLLTKGHANGQRGVSARTIGHAHRVLAKALKDAAKNHLVVSIATQLETAPKADDNEKVIVRDVPALIGELKNSRLYAPAMIALFGGLRRGEILALKWGRVDLDKKVIQVRESLEPTPDGVRFKSPKTRSGKRDVTLPDILVDALRDHRKAQLELRMRLGTGRLQDDDLLFTDIDGNPITPNTLSVAWFNFAKRIGMADVTFHALRHTHASQLIDQGVDIVTISTRLGHAKPDITLRVYAHLFKMDDSRAAEAINALLK